MNISKLINSSVKANLSPSELILSTKVWSPSKALEVLGIKLTKPHTPSQEVLGIIFNEVVGCSEVVGCLVDEIVAEVRKLNPVFSKDTLKPVIRSVWDFYYSSLVNSRESKIANRIIVSTVDNLPNSIGRNIFTVAIQSNFIDLVLESSVS